MDQKKNRTDLLAAGRKTLQQFRQKKNKKGNSTKFSGSSTKSGRDTAGGTATEAKLHPAGGEGSQHDARYIIDVAESGSGLDPGSVGIASRTNEAMPEDVGIVEIVSPEETAVLEGSGMSASRLSETADEGYAAPMGDSTEGMFSSVRKDDRYNMSNTSDAMVAEENLAVLSLPLLIDFSSEPERQQREEQVTDVGAMQEIGSSSKDQNDGGMWTKSEVNNSRSSHETVDGNRTACLEKSLAAEEIPVPMLISNDDNSLLNIAAAENIEEDSQSSHGFPIISDPFTEPELVSAMDLRPTGGLTEDMLDSSGEMKAEVFNVSGGHVVIQTDCHLNGSDHTRAERLSEFETDYSTQGLGFKQIDLSSALEGNMIKLSQLAEILQKLEGEEMGFVLMSTNFREARETKFYDAFERLKEQLYVTSFSKDALHLQLSESENLIDEVCAANMSLVKDQANHETLAEDILQCKRELHQVLLDRQELQKELLNSKDKVQDLDARVNELHNNLEIAHAELSSLSSDLLDCRNLVKALEFDNENLHRSLKVISEEKIHISEEKRNILLENEKIVGELERSKAALDSLHNFLADETKRFEEKNDSMFFENSKLLANLEDFKGRVEAVEAEKKILNEILETISEERDELKHNEALWVQQIDNVSKELTDSKYLVDTLQTKVSDLIESVTSITEEKNKLEEEKKSLYADYEEKSHELAVMKTLEAGLQADSCKAVNDLKEASFHIKKLTEEKETLYADLELQKLKLIEFDANKHSYHGEVAARKIEDDNFTSQEPMSDCPSLEQLEFKVYEDSSGFVALKRNLRNVGMMMQKLEIEIEAMHLHMTSLGNFSDKVAAPGVSRLIQAFESKSQVDDVDPVAPPIMLPQTTVDSYIKIKMVMQSMRMLLKELLCDEENASGFCRLMNSTLPANADGVSQSSYDSLREYTDLVEMVNIEHMVLYEIMREHIGRIVIEEDELSKFCNVLQKREQDLKSENSQLGEKLIYSQDNMNELQDKFEIFCRDSDEMVNSMSNQLQNLQAEVAERESILEEEWNSVFSQIVLAVGELDSSIKTSWAGLSACGDNNLDIVGNVVSSIVGAGKVIEDARGQLDSAMRDYQEISNRSNEALNGLQRLHNELTERRSKTTGYYPNKRENLVVHDSTQGLVNPAVFNILLDQIRELFGEGLKLESEYKEATAELMSRVRELEDVERRCLKEDTILKLVEEVEQSVKLEMAEKDGDDPASHLESLMYLLVQKYIEANQGLTLSTAQEMQIGVLRGEVEQLNLAVLLHETENLVFKESLRSAVEGLVCLNFKVQEKVIELEQSEQRVSSLREKLSIAVTKGKGLISQRDSLKQSLSENSRELEKSSIELQSKDARLEELETKLKDYMEAGERMEALESELSYIRNSATALRESFLLKDSVLQRIEEILEDLELPEHFHSRDIIEKIDWLSKSVGSNSLPLGDWDRRNSIGGSSYSDFGNVGGDGLKEETRQNADSVDDIRRRYEELQNKFYGLAEQNDMLEQSLLERNNLVQRWEEILDRIDMPSQLRSMDPGDKFQWLENALGESQSLCYSLQQKVNNLESFCGSLTAEAEISQRRTSELEVAIQQACVEKEIMANDLEVLRRDNATSSNKIADLYNRNDILETEVKILRDKKLEMEEEIRRTEDAVRRLQDLNADLRVRSENLQNEVSILQEQRLTMEENIHHTEDAIRRLHKLVCDALQDSFAEYVDVKNVACLEEILVKFIQKYEMLSSGNPVDIDSADLHITERGKLSHRRASSEDQDVATLRKNLDDSIGELAHLKEERDSYLLNSQSLLQKVDGLELKKKELQEKLNEEEQRSSSLREKLNVAVRKGKSLVQQRDAMKQVIEDLNAEVERLKSENSRIQESSFEHEKQVQSLSSIHERVLAMESENNILKDRLAETERWFHEKNDSWNSIVNNLDDIGLGFAFSTKNPVENLKELGKYLLDLRSGLDSREAELRKSKRAADLLLAELNDVQERNDALQEELAKAFHELSVLSREKDLAEMAKHEALVDNEKLSQAHSEENNRQISELVMLRSGIENMQDDLSTITREVSDVLSRDVAVLQFVKSTMKSFLESESTRISTPLFPDTIGGAMSWKCENKVFMKELASVRKQLYNHSQFLQHEASLLSELVMNVYGEYTSQKNSYELLKTEVKKLESVKEERDSEFHILRQNVSLLFETCASAISEIESWKDHHVDVGGNAWSSRASEMKVSHEGGYKLWRENEQSIKEMCDKLLAVVRNLVSMQNELLEVGQAEMKRTVVNLQKELQEKDVQKDKICTEFVNQIKVAETNSKNYLLQLQQASVELRDSKRQLEVMDEEHKALKQRIREMQDQETNSMDLQQKVDILRSTLASKEQEYEALMQALDEQEAEMEGQANKIDQLENELQQKNKDLENLEVSRTKALKRLSVTVSKFDELHFLSESLLSEVERLQGQLQERDGEISFLRQEVTRSTNDALTMSQITKKSNSNEINDMLAWFDSLIYRREVSDIVPIESNDGVIGDRKELLQKKILGLISDLENLRAVAQKSNEVLHEERNKVEELARKEEYLKKSLREKESQLVMLQGAGDSAKAAASASPLEIVEAGQMTSNWVPPGTIASQVRSLRKANSDQVAIAIDADPRGDMEDDDDDDKAHGFKSLTTSPCIPRFTRPVSDIVDGLWMSCDRAMMRRPALRLSVIIYWAVLHTLLATYVV